jgi:hypothetical protein
MAVTAITGYSCRLVTISNQNCGNTSLRRSYPSLILSEPIQPLKYRLDVLPSEELLLDKRFCVTLSGNIISYLTQTHLVSLAVTVWLPMQGWRVAPRVS